MSDERWTSEPEDDSPSELAGDLVPYDVGEAGPEVFVPDEDGTVEPVDNDEDE